MLFVFFCLAWLFWDSFMLLHIARAHPFSSFWLEFHKRKNQLGKDFWGFTVLGVFFLGNFCLIQGHKYLSPMFSSRSFIISSFTFRSMIHFEIIFVCDVQYELKFTFLPVEIQLFQNRLLKDCLFSTELPLYFCRKWIDHIYVSLFLDSSFPFVNLFPYRYSNNS